MLVVKNLRKGDRAQRGRLLKYLHDNPDPGVRGRPEDQLNHAQSSGLVLIVEDGAKVCGCSFVYKFAEDKIVFSEIGTMRVTENGLRLQQILAQIHLVQMFLEEYYDVKNEIFAVVKSGTGSEHVLRNYVGMQDWVAPALLVNLRDRAKTPFSSDKICLYADIACVRKAFSDLKNLYVGKKIFRTPSGNAMLQVDLGWFNDGILDTSA
jgi:hypothetical protein